MSSMFTSRRAFGRSLSHFSLAGLAAPALGTAFFLTGMARANALPAPSGKVVLSVTGAIGKRNVEGRADFDMAMLAALPQTSITTETPWYDSPRKFTGPLLRDVLELVGATGTQLRAVALNDYKVSIPREDADRFDVVMARLLDDQPMPVRAKGPLFIVYPFRQRAELRADRYYNRSAWQLRTLDVS
jgi:hypothetical protein